MATSSACTHSPRVTGWGKCSRQLRASPKPVAMPSLADRYCTSTASRLLTTMTQTSRVPYCDPAVILVAKLPGST